MMPMMPMMGVQSSFRGMMPGFQPGGFNRGMTMTGVNRNVFVEPSFRGGSPNFSLHPTMPRNMAPLFNPATPIFNPAMPIFNPTTPIFNPTTPIFNQTRPSIFLP